jgi:nicotinamidase-related amidase
MNTKNAPECLVIVDMQDWFLNEMSDKVSISTYKKLMTGVNREIATAKKKRLPIVVLEFAYLETGFDDAEHDEYTRTTREIRNQLKGYGRAYYVLKNDDDGATEVIKTLQGINTKSVTTLPRETGGKRNPLREWIKDGEAANFTVVGVNASACVAETCRGIVRYNRHHTIKVPHDASLDVYTGEFAADTPLVHAPVTITFDA